MTDRETKFHGLTESGFARRTLLKAAAITGLAGSGVAAGRTGTHDDENTITIRGDGEIADYRFTVSDSVELTANAGGGEDVVDGRTVTGRVGAHGDDTFRFTGTITSFTFLQGHAIVLINGEVVEDPVRLPNVITVQGRGENVSYRFSVSGHATTTENSGGGEDVVRDGTVTGTVAGRGEDTFRFSGDITSFEDPDGPLRVTVEFDGA